jgi:hypothetical protein
MNESLYTIRIAKVAAAIADTKLLLSQWDLNQDVSQNMLRFHQTNLLGDVSRVRRDDVLKIFHQRYWRDPQIGSGLAIMVQGNVPGQWVDPILYYYSAKNDKTLYDLVSEVVFDRQRKGFNDISVEQIIQKLREWVAAGKTAANWNERTIRNVAQHALAALRDFGILHGKVIKSITPLYLPIESFTFIAFELWRNLRSGEKVLQSPDWNLFFLSQQAIERFFLEAHQERLLSYSAAGSIVRLEFPAYSLMEVANALVQRANP